MIEEKELQTRFLDPAATLQSADGQHRQHDLILDARRTLGKALDAIGKLEFLNAVEPPNVLSGISFYEEVKRFECAIIARALRETRGNQTRAASLLGLNTTTLNAKIKAYSIDWRDYR
jgi:DNA-binding NtrC family response regulator